MKKSLTILFWVILTQAIYAQQQYVFEQKIPTAGQTVAITRPVTSVVFEFATPPNWSECRLIADNDTFLLQPDPHAEQVRSKLIVFEKSVQQLQLYSDQPSLLLGVYATPLTLPTYYRQFRVAADCEKPPVVPASVWRAGLTPPRELPVATAVKFIIVHHEAGSNSPVNYTNTVRNIYVFHTQTNGWNDVGYNFLIAQDGTVFEGRDGQGRLDGDNVQGAHFCGFNAATMGICLLGNYNSAQPSDAALTALVKLTAWKMRKESLIDPTSSGLHTSSGRNLVVVSGHRDGCATECPGNNLYERLPQIRADIANTCDGLKPIITAQQAPPTTFSRVYPNPSVGFFTLQAPQPVRQLSVLDMLGRVVLSEKFTTPVSNFDFQIPTSGTFLLKTTSLQNTEWVQKIVVKP
jgi:N-acetylmuramoyl-L-alanine amidase/Secretion system C-terminal sorting domain